MKHRFLLALAATLGLAVAHQAQAADPGNGNRIYLQYCVGCHGPNGIAVMPGAPHFARAERLMQPDFALMQTVKTGKGAMPPFMGMLQDREILDAIAFIRTLVNNNPVR